MDKERIIIAVRRSNGRLTYLNLMYNAISDAFVFGFLNGEQFNDCNEYFCYEIEKQYGPEKVDAFFRYINE